MCVRTCDVCPNLGQRLQFDVLFDVAYRSVAKILGYAGFIRLQLRYSIDRMADLGLWSKAEIPELLSSGILDVLKLQASG